MTPGQGLYVSDDQHRPLAWFTTDDRTFGSKPRLKEETKREIDAIRESFNQNRLVLVWKGVALGARLYPHPNPPPPLSASTSTIHLIMTIIL